MLFKTYFTGGYVLLLCACGSSGSSSEGLSSDDPTSSSGGIIIQEDNLGHCVTNATIETDYDGYTGSGYLNGENSSETGISWQVTATQSGNYSALWRYASGDTTSRNATIFVNGENNGAVIFDSTGAWSTWGETSAKITLSAGSNTIIIMPNNTSLLANIDYIEVSGEGVNAQECLQGSSNSSSSSSSGGVCTKPSPPNTDDVKPATIDWVWEQRIQNEALNFENLIFDQIVAAQGKLNYCVRWESDQHVTASQRDQMQEMINRQFEHWVTWLRGYDCFPYDKIPVKIVGWAVTDRSQLEWENSDVPIYVGNLDSGGAPQCPEACGRFFHRDNDYSNCPGGYDNHYDMSLWGTKGFGGGAGGDWGQRVSSDYILNNLVSDHVHVIEHEIGHGFNLPDFYDANQFPPTGLPPAVMQAGAASSIQPWDGWMLRRVWSELKDQTGRLDLSVKP